MRENRIVRSLCALAATLLVSMPGTLAAQPVSIGGFIPFVGIGMTDESKTLDSLDLGDIPFIADPAFSLGAPLLGDGGGFFDVALLDTGAATHIITQEAFNGFDLIGNGLRGTNTQDVGGATGVIVTEINDAAGIYTAGLGDRTAAGATLGLNTAKLRGQTSIATLTAPEEWTLPNILGLPMAAQHAIVIRNDLPQIFEHQGRTMRTPQVEFTDLGTDGVYGPGAGESILRRAPLILNPGIGFIQGPQYVFNLNFDDILGGGGDIDISNNPASPSVVQDSNGNGGAMFLEVDMRNGSKGFEDKQLLFDTGADLTVVSQITAKRLGFDAVLDTPDFVLEVEGSGGVQGGVPGFYIDELNIDTIGGDFTLHNLPIAVLDVTNPNDPGNIIPGIIGMHLFNGRNLIIDAEASFGQGGNGPSLYISDPVTNVRTWKEGSGPWTQASSWEEAQSPNQLSDVLIESYSPGGEPPVFLSGPIVEGDEVAYRVTVRGDAAYLSVGSIADDQASLTVYGEVLVEENATIFLSGGHLDAQFVNIDSGTLSGTGTIFVGTGPISSSVRNISGTVSPEPYNGPTDPMLVVGTIDIDGDYSNLEEATLEMDLGGVGISDLLTTTRFAFLSGILEVDWVSEAPNLSIGDMYTILTAGEGIFGEFDNLILPTEYTWDINYLANSVVLEVTGLSLPGDFNGDGIVDVADYTVWRDGYGVAYDIGHYIEWRDAMLGGGGAGALGVPEPASAGLLLLGLLGGCRFSIRPNRG